LSFTNAITFKNTDAINSHGHIFTKCKTIADDEATAIHERERTCSLSINQLEDFQVKHGKLYSPQITSNQCKICRQAINHDWCLCCQECDLKIHEECLDVTDAHPCPIKFDVSKLRHAFLNVFTSIMRNYQKFYPKFDQTSSVQESDSLNQIYETNSFLLDMDIESRLFMEKFSTSQSFYVFIRQRHPLIANQDSSIIFFDECIKAKRNRSILQLQKEVVEFLTDESFGLHHTVLFDGPNTESVNLSSTSIFT
jgi:hypothetical protein